MLALLRAGLYYVQEQFARDGFVVFPQFLQPVHVDRVRADIRELPRYSDTARGSGPMACLGFPTEGLGGLPTHPAAVEAVAAVIGHRRFAMRHINAQQFGPGEPGNTWHHDYVCGPPGQPYPVDHGRFPDRHPCSKSSRSPRSPAQLRDSRASLLLETLAAGSGRDAEPGPEDVPLSVLPGRPQRPGRRSAAHAR